MANTNYLKNEVENWVRSWLAGQFPGHSFAKHTLKLSTGGQHEFDAVSSDRNIIAGIKTNSYKTKSGNLPQGKFAELYRELYFLSLFNGSNKVLILTNEDMFNDFRKRSEGKVAEGIRILFCQLPPAIIQKVKAVQRQASSEQK